MKEKAQKDKPILIFKSYNLKPLEDIAHPVFLDSRGKIICGELTISDLRRRDFKRTYYFIKEFLDLKKRKYDVSWVRYKTLSDIAWELKNKGQKAVSVDRLVEIVRWQNLIAKSKEYIKKRLAKHVSRRYWKKRDKELKKLYPRVKH